MELKITYENIADRVRAKARAKLPIYTISQKEARFILESVVKDFGGLKVFSDQDENSSAYNILGVEDYVFIDRSIVRLVGSDSYTIVTFMSDSSHASFFGISYYGKEATVNEVENNINKQLNSMSGLKVIQLKAKYLMKLPIGEAY